LYPRSKECGIDDYTLVEDSFNVPILVHEAKQCVDYWQYGKSIYPSLELCADAVKANTTNCASGLGYFFYSATEKLCRCCTKSIALQILLILPLDQIYINCQLIMESMESLLTTTHNKMESAWMIMD
jgi:hypothetical protein